MTIFNFSNYKQFVIKRVQEMPNRGRGQFRRMSLHLGVNSTMISQVFKGDRDLTLEQGISLCEFLGLGELEQKYFITLLLKSRAGSEDLRQYFKNEEAKIKKEAEQIKSHVSHAEITEEHRALFYSDWIYSGIRILSSIDKYNTIDDIAEYFKLPRARVNQVVDFLIQTGLCIEKDGKMEVGPQSTHVDNKSPLVNSHRRNWHQKAIEQMHGFNDEDLFYSGPVSISKADREAVRAELVNTISKILKRVHKSPEEEVVCLNIDWFGF